MTPHPGKAPEEPPSYPSGIPYPYTGLHIDWHTCPTCQGAKVDKDGNPCQSCKGQGGWPELERR